MSIKVPDVTKQAPSQEQSTKAEKCTQKQGHSPANSFLREGLDGFTTLSFSVTESGSNISQGQLQLVYIARAILKGSSVMVLDEATASIDHETDLKTQACIRQMDCTVTAVAHRLRMVIDYDRIVVLESGEIKENDHPWKLLQRGGIFKSMCEAATNKEDLRNLAGTAWEVAGHKENRSELKRFAHSHHSVTNIHGKRRRIVTRDKSLMYRHPLLRGIAPGFARGMPSTGAKTTG